MDYIKERNLEKQQRALCDERGIEFVACHPNTNTGIALGTQGLQPINGLRHPPVDYSNGWFLWAGEQFSSAPDFFSAVHAEHVVDIFPDAIRFLGLPPGYRFLIAGNYVDIWFDPTLLNV